MFITIEGIEGAGKSTAIQFLKQLLQKNNVDFIITREPGGTEIAEEIRSILLNHHTEIMHADTELLLVFAGRAQHLAQVIKPALAAGTMVVCDRFTDTSYAYQGGGRDIPLQRVAVLEELVQGKLRPDLTIILDISPEVGLTRVKNNNRLDRIESEKIEFFRKARSYYLQQVEKHPARYKIIDASKPLPEVEKQLEKLCTQYIFGNKKTGNI